MRGLLQVAFAVVGFLQLACAPSPTVNIESGSAAKRPIPNGESGDAHRYTAVDLGTLGGTSSRAYAINDSGQVVGDSQITGNSAVHAFSYSKGVLTDLGTLRGIISTATAVNNSGQVVGFFRDSKIGGVTEDHAFLYEKGVMTDIGTLGGTYSYAYGINNSGQVVGESYLGKNVAMHAFLYESGVMKDLGTLSGITSHANAINDSGVVVGRASTVERKGDHAFLYQGGTMKELVGEVGSVAFGINTFGHVVGMWATRDSAVHAFQSKEGVISDLGTLGGSESCASAINASGQVVGYSDTSKGQRHAFLLSGGVMMDLNDLVSLPTILDEAQGINTSGQIVAHSIYGRAYLLTPVTDSKR